MAGARAAQAMRRTSCALFGTYADAMQGGFAVHRDEAGLLPATLGASPSLRYCMCNGSWARMRMCARAWAYVRVRVRVRVRVHVHARALMCVGVQGYLPVSTQKWQLLKASSESRNIESLRLPALDSSTAAGAAHVRSV